MHSINEVQDSEAVSFRASIEPSLLASVGSPKAPMQIALRVYKTHSHIEIGPDFTEPGFPVMEEITLQTEYYIFDKI